MTTKHGRTRPNAARRGTPHQSTVSLEPLEPRQLLTAYFGQSFADYFHLSHTLLDNIAPPTGTEYADFGAAAAGLGDIDGDNYGDFAISAPGRLNTDGSTDIAGAVFIFSGKTGSLIRTLSDGFAGFGASIANLGDTSGDGKADVAVGSANFDGNDDGIIEHFGRAYIYSGAGGAALMTLDGIGLSDEFGYAVALAGDVDHDTVNDLAVGAPGAGANAEGSVYIISGALGISLRTFTGESAGDRFGAALFTSAAVPGLVSGFPALLWVGAPHASVWAGSVSEFDAGTGAMNWRQYGDHSGPYTNASRLGAAIVAVASDGGTAAHVFVGRPSQSWSITGRYPTRDEGTVSVYSATTGALEREIRPEGVVFPGREFGRALWVAGPSDVLVQQNKSGDSFVTVRDEGRDPPPWTGRALALGDLDGDGYYDLATQDEGATTIVVKSSLVLNQSLVSGAANDALTFIDVPAEGRAIVNGKFLRYEEIPGLLPGDSILGVNNSMVIVGKASGEWFIVRGGVRALLADAVTTVVSPDGTTPDLSALLLLQVGNDGTVALETNADAFADRHEDIWIFKNGVLTYLWKGEFSNVNSAGDILGYSEQDAGFVLRRADGTKTKIIYPDFTPSYLADDGTVVGFAIDSKIGLLRGTSLTILPPRLVLPPDVMIKVGYYTVYSARILGMDGSGNILVGVMSYSSPFGLKGSLIRSFLITAAGVLHDVDDIAFGASAAWATANDSVAPKHLFSAGRLLDRDRVFVTDDTGAAWTAGPGVSTTTATGGTSLVMFTVNAQGEAIALTRTPDGWVGQRITGLPDGFKRGTTLGVHQFLSFVDPYDGQTKAVAITPSGMLQFLLQKERGVYSRWTAVNLVALGTPPPIIGNATVFTNASGTVEVAGVSPAGDLVIYFEVPAGDHTIWAASNLTKDHIQASGQTFVPVAGNLTSFAMPWGAMNIAYLDASGNAQIVWWTPGLPAWRIDSLSQSAGFAGALHGILTSYTTPWNGQNVTATDANGDLVTLWWAPGLPTWRTDRLVGGTPAQLDDSTITGFSTPWGGLNVVGLNKSTGKLTAYWWAPGMPAWIVEEFKITGAPAGLQLKGRVSAAVAPSGNMFIAAVTSDNHLANIWISPDTGLKWTFEDVTMAV